MESVKWINSSCYCIYVYTHRQSINPLSPDKKILKQNGLISEHLKYTTQKKVYNQLRVVLCIINFKLLQIKLKFSDDISYTTISSFCERHYILNDENLIVQKPLFFKTKNTNVFLTISYPSVFGIVSESMQYYLFNQA